MGIKALCITEDADRPTVATFIGLTAAGVEMSVACPDDAAVRERLAAAGVELLDIPMRSRIDKAAIRMIRERLQTGDYDILHLFSNKALLNGLRASRGLPVKVVAYRGIVGNVSFLDPLSWARILNPRIDRIVCVANAVRDFFLQMRPAFLRMPESRPVTIYKGHSLDWYRETAADLRSIGLPTDAFVIGCVANYRPRKGIEYLVDAMAELPEDWNAHLILVGTMDAAKLDEKIDNSPVSQRIHRLGHRKDAPSLTAACDVFVLPSIKREGLARSLIEAMAYGVAPVVTDCGGSPELVVDGESGLVVPVRSTAALVSAISRLYRDEALRARLGQAAKARIRDRFRIEDTIAQTLALYRELLEPGRDSR